MACGSCGSRSKGSAQQEYLVTYRDSTTERFSDLTAVRQAITLKGGGTYKMVAKETK